jgi:hypothetical protein
METTPQQGRRKSGVGVFTALAGMLVTFLAGIYVGLHPGWIPVKTSWYPDVGEPVAIPPASSAPTTQSDTRPAEAGN